MQPDAIATPGPIGLNAPAAAPALHWPSLPPYDGESYYDIPPIKHSHYEWRTSLAFFCNGLAGGAQILSAQADGFGGPEGRKVVRAGRYLAVTAATAGTLTLISALHTRQRWYNMLRLYKSTSPMSIGIWAIAPFTLLSAVSAGGQWLADSGREKAGRWIGRLSGIPAALLGGMVMTYMGTELEETVMPFWSGAFPALSPLYAAAGMANAAAAIQWIAGADGRSGSMPRLQKIAFVSGVAEGVLTATLDSRKEAFGGLCRLTQSGTAASLLLRLYAGLDRDRHPSAAAGSALLKLVSGLLLQFVLVYAGRESGKRARDYFEHTRSPNRSSPKRPTLPGSRPRRPMAAGLRWGLIALGTVAVLTTLARGRDYHDRS